MTSTFRSYVDLNHQDRRPTSASVPEESGLLPSLLDGEVLIAQAQRVLKFTALSEQKQGITGYLFVTNFRLSFVSADASYKLVDQNQRNAVLGLNDVCLINIDSVYQVSKTGVRKKKLEPGTTVPTKVKSLQIVCRDFRVFTFSFKFSCIGEDKTVVNAILHHAFPAKQELLFAYEYKSNCRTANSTSYKTEQEFPWKTRMFVSERDCKDEIDRVKCDSWRVTRINWNFVCRIYPKYFVVPASLSDAALTNAASSYLHYTVPTWSWGNKDGCVLVRSMGIQHADERFKIQAYEVIKAMKKANPYGKDPVFINLDDLLPSIREIYLGFCRFKELFTPEMLTQFWEHDLRFLSLVEASHWLQMVSLCLNVSNQVATKIAYSKISVILKESGGRDLSCIISSLAQIILDPHYRTISGFQSLIQKEWVAMGHPFLTRLGRIKTEEESPVFLLFLDCVWQMLQQFPASFEYTETYLTTIWDSAHVSIFDTFLFDCQLDRQRACEPTTSSSPSKFELRSVWDWNLQFTKQQLTLFLNPLYSFAESVTNSFLKDSKTPATTSATANHVVSHQQRLYRSQSLWSLGVLVNNLPDIKECLSAFIRKWPKYQTLPIQWDIPLLKIWRLCYCRWMPPVQVVSGGPPAEYMEQCLMIKEIKSLQRQIAILVNKTSTLGGLSSDFNMSSLALNHLSQNENNHELVTSAYPFSAGGTPWVPGISLSYFRQNSYIPSDDELDNE